MLTINYTNTNNEVNMIDAATARNITKESSLTVEEVLDDICHKIKQRAYNGENTLRYYSNRCNWRNDNKDATTYNLPFVDLIIKELVGLGYDAFMSKGEHYKVASEEGEFYNVFLFISW